MENVGKALVRFIKSQPEFETQNIFLDSFAKDDDDEIILIHDPSTITEKYIDGSYKGEAMFDIRSRAKNGADARKWLEDISALLHGKEIQYTELGFTGDCEVNTTPQFISVDDKERETYSISVVVSFLQD